MVILVGALPTEKVIWIYDSEQDKFENKICNITVQPWEITKIEEYFENITAVINQPIDCYYLFYNWPYYNQILKKFIDISKKHKISKIQIITLSQEYAIASLEYINHFSSDSLCVFICHNDRVLCSRIL